MNLGLKVTRLLPSVGCGFLPVDNRQFNGSLNRISSQAQSVDAFLNHLYDNIATCCKISL
jgi:hypothetical protein